jgi:hypothetical protein
METIKDPYIRAHRLSDSHPPPSTFADRAFPRRASARFTEPVLNAQAIFCRRRHQPRRPLLAKIRPRKFDTGDGAGKDRCVAAQRSARSACHREPKFLLPVVVLPEPPLGEDVMDKLINELLLLTCMGTFVASATYAVTLLH